MGAMGQNIARSYLKPTLSAGKKEAQRLFGRSAMASEANEEVVKRVLERNILGEKNPEMAITNALEDVENKLQGVVGDQPTKFNNLLSAIIARGRNAATQVARNIPGAQAAIEQEIAATRTGNLGGKLDYGTPRPPAIKDTVSAQPIASAMRGPEVTPGRPRPTQPQYKNEILQQIENQSPRTSIVREATESNPRGMPLPTDPLGNLIARNYSPEVKAPAPGMAISHRPQPVTAQEALRFARASARDKTNWDEPTSGLTDTFRRQQEHAARLATKRAVPEARPLLKEEAELISALRVVPQAMNRESNKNTIARLPAMLAALGAIGTGRPIRGAALALGGVGIMDRNSGQIAQALYNVGKSKLLPKVSPEMARELGKRFWQAALLSQLEKTDEGQ
jgi:hypothetical protein